MKRSGIPEAEWGFPGFHPGYGRGFHPNHMVGLLSTSRRILWGGTNDRADLCRAAVIPRKEVLGGGNSSADILEELTMGYLPAKVPPAHFERIEPRTVGRQRQQHEPSGGATDSRLNVLVLRGAGIIPREVDRLLRVLIEQGAQQLGHLLAPFMGSEQDPRLPCLVINGT
jgi:hypothetical protein